MRLAFACAMVLVFVGSAGAQGTTKQSQAYFPRAGWSFIGTSPDAPSLRTIAVAPAKAMCEVALNAARQTTKNVRISYTACQPVALGQPTDEPWWIFSNMTADPPMTAWIGTTEQAMCEQMRAAAASNNKGMQIGRTCQPANLKLAAQRVPQPAHALLATPQFPAQGWGYVQSAQAVPKTRVLSLHAAKATCEMALREERQTPRKTPVSYTACRSVIHGGGIDSGDWWMYHFVTANPPMTMWLGTTEKTDCDDLRRSMADPSDPYSKQVRLGACQRVTLRMN